eukprot:10720148-Prorocentrum_lima.AAC.1
MYRKACNAIKFYNQTCNACVRSCVLVLTMDDIFCLGLLHSPIMADGVSRRKLGGVSNYHLADG